MIDSNSAAIAEKLEQNGVYVLRHTCVGDDLSILAGTLGEIGSRADVAVVTGGLGPTSDDRSAEAATAIADVELELDHEAWGAWEAMLGGSWGWIHLPCG